jgi:hypothetical protein
VWEDGRALVLFHAIDLEDADKRSFLTDPGIVLLLDSLSLVFADRLMDAGRPVLRVLSMARMQGEVQLLSFRRELVERRLDILLHVVGDWNCQQRIVGEYAGAALNRLESEATIALARNRTYLVVLVGFFNQRSLRMVVASCAVLTWS